jgi:hypothetical protein
MNLAKPSKLNRNPGGWGTRSAFSLRASRTADHRRHFGAASGC